MKLVTSSQMKALDKAAIEEYGIPSSDLMERAGKATADSVIKHFPKKGGVAIVVGKGNNGGDGLVAARYLKSAGYDVSIFKADELDNKHLEKLKSAICIVDAIFGTGLSAEVKGKYKSAIDLINSLMRPVVSVDIPSGLSADTGNPLGVAIRAKFTVTFGLPKVGLYTNIGSEYAREVEIVDIGIPKELTDKLNSGYNLITPDLFAEYFGKRANDTNKGNYGHALVIGGSSGKIGAGLLSSRGALRIGTGLVSYALPNLAFVKFDTKSPEVMYEEIPDNGLGYLNKSALPVLNGLFQNKTAVALGPGIGTEEETKRIVTEIVKKVSLPLVIDADGLNCLVGNLNILGGKKTPVILTPHPGEMAKLAGISIKDIQADRIAVAKKFAKTHRVYLVLKGHRTVVATPDGEIFINPTGNPGMATAGMGDVLTGVIAGLLAQKIPTACAVIAGVYLHGLAGDICSEDIGERGLLASDVINALPKAMKSMARD